MAAVATGMEKAEMKMLLNRAAPDNPVSFAFALPKEPGPAILVMDKIKNPKACERTLLSAFKDARNTRWGTAAVDPDIDGSLVRFKVEKPVTGMAKRLVLTLKGTGFRKVEIVLDDGTLVEGAGGSDEESPAATADEPAPAAVPDDAKVALTQGLAALIARIGSLAADPGRKATMAKVAAMANEQIKAGNLAAAATTIARLTQVIEADAAPAVADWPAARAQLEAALSELDRQIAALQKAIRRTGDDDLLTISEVGLKVMMGSFVPPLQAALRQATDAASLRTAGPALLQAVAGASRALASDPRIAACDDNDFGVAMSIRTTLQPALTAAETALHAVAAP